MSSPASNEIVLGLSSLEQRLFRSLLAQCELEHERWEAQRRMDGWRHADLPKKDEQRRLHPDLIPYAQLSDGTKAFDRTIVQETQLICWNAGT